MMIEKFKTINNNVFVFNHVSQTAHYEDRKGNVIGISQDPQKDLVKARSWDKYAKCVGYDEVPRTDCEAPKIRYYYLPCSRSTRHAVLWSEAKNEPCPYIGWEVEYVLLNVI